MSSATRTPPRPRARLLVLGVATALVIAVVDQVTKYLAEARLETGTRVDVLGDLFGLRLFYNSGAAFSLGTGITPVLTAFACVAVVVMVVALARTWSMSWTVALGILLGGATGNLVDRLTREPGFGRGEVVDFFELPNFPIFNVADMAVVSGAVLVVLLSVRDVPFAATPDDDAAAAGTTTDTDSPAQHPKDS
ncbi:signal peptidase II [Aquipuribacter sp. MA13-6]|uniref:signal peptidase II n=1 Tax=unclassified Aquipuribacter TaxID=2635084 RepID=UPI003EE9A8FF